MNDSEIEKIIKNLETKNIRGFSIKGVSKKCKCEFNDCDNDAVWETKDGVFCSDHTFEIAGAELLINGGNA